MEFALITYCIGFAVSWFTGAAPAELPETPLNAVEQAEVRELQHDLQADSEDVEGWIRLGQIHFIHNQLEEADSALENARTLDPDDSQALAWWGSNQTKRGGAAVPWFWGIRKIIMVDEGVDALNQAIAKNSNDPVARLVRINTLLALEDRFSDFDLIFEDERYFQGLLDRDPEALPSGLLAQVNLALAQAYIWKVENAEYHAFQKYQKSAQYYLDQAALLDSNLEHPVAIQRTRLSSLSEK